MSEDRITRPYRIGWWTHTWWPTRSLARGLVTGRVPPSSGALKGRFVGRRRHARAIVRRLRKVRRPHRPWQAEADMGFARRSLTAVGAERRILADVDHCRRYGMPSPYQYWRQWRKAHRESS